MKIRELIDVKLLQTIQDQFSDATGLAAIAVDADGEYITRGSNFTDFCMKYTRGSQEGLRRCVKCDNECKGTYFCHAGLMDFSADILIEGERLGSIIGGQVLPQAPDYDKFCGIARELGIQEKDYIEALKKVPVRSEKMIRAAAELLGDVVNQLVNLQYIKRLNARKIDVFDQEIGSTIESITKMKCKVTDLKRIASMENILSLNAAVEAGRAGNAGVGFAVVAKEIGGLSRDAAQTYEQLSELIVSAEKSIHNMHQVKL